MSPDWKERSRLSGGDFIPDTESPSHDWIERYIPPDDRPHVMAVINEAIRNRSVFELEHRVIRVDDAIGWTFSRAIPLLDSHGEIIEWLGTASDVTRQRMAEDALRARHERARLLAGISARLVLREIEQRESAGELMESVFAELARHLEADKYFYFFVADDEPETLRLASSGGINAEQQAALSTIRFSENLCGAIARTRSPLIVENLQNRRMENASAIRAMGVTAYAGYPMIADGRLIGVISFAATRRIRFADEELELIQTVADLLAAAVERDRLNNAVRESEERFRNLADNMSQFAWIADAKGWLFWYNRRWYDYTGTTLEEMQGWGWKKVHHPDHTDRVVERIQRSWDTGETWEDTFPMRGKDGSYRWFLSRAVPIRDAEGKIVRWFGTNTDITEQRQAEEEIARLLAEEHRLREMAEQATRAKDEFLAVVSHELRSPLNAILGWNHLLRSKRGGDPHIAKVTETIERSGKTQLQLIEDLLDMTRIITGKMKLELLPVELGAVILSALDTVRPAANNKGIDIMLSIDPKAGQITGDPDRLQQVVWNLVSNAIKFTPGGGRVWVEALRGDAGVQIVVRDTGQGVAPDLLPYVFDRFRQGDASAARRFGGLGLGLALVKHMVELHGGRVIVESPGEGLGATFTVNLPIRAVRGDNGMDGKAAHGQYAPIRQRTPGLEGLRALVVDDEAGARELLAATLELHGVLVTGVDSTDAALAEIESRLVETGVEPFDVLISDIGMPGADGYELIRRVRAHSDRRVSRLRAVALTAYARSEDRLRVLRAGFYMHVPKPVDEEELTTVIIALMGGHSR